MTTKQTRTQQQRRDATSKAVLQSATVLFGEKGYQNTSLEDIAQHSGNTIRPIYHYFKSKKNLFQHVAESKESYLLQVFESMDSEGDQQLPVNVYWDAFTRVCKEPGFRQIVLIDAPNILGKERWMESPIVEKAWDYFDKVYPQLNPESRRLVSRVCVAGLIEAAMVLSEADNNSEEESFDELIKFYTLITAAR
ncbi:MAG: TetR/AcrR family transcriptional regulator [Pseudomonadales bacterium]|nr:TetR/AcrR family transcriptional regulator [Pseudomonadales bacterium]